MGKHSFFQDQLHGNHCFGCGAWNDKGLQIKSYWDGNNAVCIFYPKSSHSAMPPDIVNGGIIASVIDCHCVCTAIAFAYKMEGRNIHDGEKIWYATGSLKVKYKKPTPIHNPFTVTAQIVETIGKKTTLKAQLLTSNGDITCEAEVVALRVSSKWTNPDGLMPQNGK